MAFVLIRLLSQTPTKYRPRMEVAERWRDLCTHLIGQHCIQTEELDFRKQRRSHSNQVVMNEAAKYEITKNSHLLPIYLSQAHSVQCNLTHKSQLNYLLHWKIYYLAQNLIFLTSHISVLPLLFLLDESSRSTNFYFCLF